MEDYEKEKLANSPWREPLGKQDYENLIQAEVIIKKLDRKFRQLTKFHSRYSPPHAGPTSTRPTTPAASGACWSAPTSAGTTPTPSTPTTSLRRSRSTATTSRPTSRTTARTSASRRYPCPHPVPRPPVAAHRQPLQPQQIRLPGDLHGQPRGRPDLLRREEDLQVQVPPRPRLQAGLRAQERPPHRGAAQALPGEELPPDHPGLPPRPSHPRKGLPRTAGKRCRRPVPRLLPH